jgi:NAD(P)-dependent dehydrogenase (short-subunit alcohol dehydrogenase family)
MEGGRREGGRCWSTLSVLQCHANGEFVAVLLQSQRCCPPPPGPLPSVQIVTTRFPKDCAQRYAEQPDFPEWQSRLKVYGLDLRDMRTLENFCAALVQQLPRLDIIINNACQTIRRPASYYQHLMPTEATPLAMLPPSVRGVVGADTAAAAAGSGGGGASSPMLLLADFHGGSASADAGAGAGTSDGGSGGGRSAEAAATADAAADAADAAAAAAGARTANGSGDSGGGSAPVAASVTTSAALSQVVVTAEDAEALRRPELFPTDTYDVNHQQLDLRRRNSWLLRLGEIETGEVAEVFAINSIAPFVINSKLKPLLLRRSTDTTSGSSGEGGEGGGGGGGEGGEGGSGGSGGDGGGGGGGAHSSSRSNGSRNGSSSRSSSSSSGSGGGGGGTGGSRLEPRFIVNVSAMEGKFYRFKSANHPHTNMAKAALNMMTRTSAAGYAEDHIYMNAVDTGWINDENPLEKARGIAGGFVC